MKSILQDKKACYAAFKAHDVRFDGRIYVGVSSTGIYCRPVCRVKMPKIENCSYYAGAAAAEAAGFRPCLRCRPELAPGLSPVDASPRLARKAAQLIAEGRLSDSSLAELTESLGISDRHLRRVFFAEFGVSPVQYLQTQRLLLAKQLLTDTQLSITAVAMAAGFGSIRRFNGLFRKQYKLTPTALRKKEDRAEPHSQHDITLRLGYRPPYAWEQMLSFLAGRAIPGVEAVVDNSYRRTVLLYADGAYRRGWLAVRHDPKNHALLATISPSLLPVIAQVLVRLRALFDLDCDPLEIYQKLAVMNELAPQLCVAGVRLPGCFDPYEAAMRAILGQQITVKAARTLAMRMALNFGEKIETPYTELTHSFPTSKMLHKLARPIEKQLGPLGITAARSRSILALTEAVLAGTINFSGYDHIETELNKLLTLPGIGPWTAQYMAMRAWHWPDAFPHTDYGVKKALSGMSEKQILQAAEKWRPWRSYAVMNLWNSL